jgi:hypothetical protein
MTIPLRFDAITAAQATVARAYLDARAAERHHLVMYLSGAHAYGFPSPDSDLDLKCIHIAPTGALVGLAVDDGGAEAMTVIDGVEVDYGSNELGDVLRGVLKGNGNYLERILGDLVLGGDRARCSPRCGRWPRPRSRVGSRVTTAASPPRSGAPPTRRRPPSACSTCCAPRAPGATCSRPASSRPTSPRLAPTYGLDVSELCARKRTGERVPLTGGDLAHWRDALGAAVAAVDAAVTRSALPLDAPIAAVADLDAWLRDVRHAHW